MKLIFFAVVVLLLAGLTGLLVRPSVREISRSQRIDKEIITLQQKAEKINAKNSLLQEKIAYLKSDDYKERVAKDKLNLKNNGEEVVWVQLINKGVRDGTDKGEVLGVEKEKKVDLGEVPNYQKWWRLFFNNK